MGNSGGIKLEKKIIVLRNFQLYENSLYSYFSYFNNDSPFLIQNLKFYLVPKDYIIDFCNTFNYKTNFDYIKELNNYIENIKGSKYNEKVIQKLIDDIKKESNPAYKNAKFKKIINNKIIKEKTSCGGYELNLNKDGLFIPLTYSVWIIFKKYYNCDIELECESFSNNGELFIITEEERLDTFFVLSRTKDKIHHYCFIINTKDNLENMIIYFKQNSVKNLLDMFNIRNIEEKEEHKFLEKKIDMSEIIPNCEISVYYLDTFNFHDDDCYFDKIAKLQQSFNGYIEHHGDNNNVLQNLNSSNSNNNIYNDKNTNNLNKNVIGTQNGKYRTPTKSKETQKNINVESGNCPNYINNDINQNKKKQNKMEKRKKQNKKEEKKEDKEEEKKEDKKEDKKVDKKEDKKEDKDEEKKEDKEEWIKEEKSADKEEQEGINLDEINIGLKDDEKNKDNIDNNNNISTKYTNSKILSTIRINNNENYPYIIISIIQCLFNIPKIKNFLSESSTEIIGNNNTNLLYLIYTLNTKINQNCQWQEEIDNIITYIQNKQINSNPKELLLEILENLHNDAIGIIEEKKKIDISISESEAFDIFEKELFKTSEISKYYIGKQKKVYQCSKCNAKHYKFKTFKIINIEVNNKNILNVTDSKYSSEMDEYYRFKFEKYINNNEKEKEYKNHSCKSCEGNKFVTRKNIYEYCPEVLIISFDKNYVDENNKKSFIIDLVDDLNMNEYIENKSPDINFKYTLNSFMRYDLVQHKYVTFLKIKNTWTIMDKDISRACDLDFINGIYNPKILFYVRE